MAEPRFFTTLPANAMADTRLTALDIRCLAVISWHDGMSAHSGKGAGCYARNSTLAKIVQTDVTNFSKALSRLMSMGYVSREPQEKDKRRFTLRVQWPADDSWRTDQQSGGEIVGELTNDYAGIVGEDTNRSHEIVGDREEIVGDRERENASFSSEIDLNYINYISLNEEIDFDESREKNSAKRPDFRRGHTASIGDIVGKEKEPAEAGLGRGSLRDRLPRNFDSLPVGAMVSHLDRVFGEAGRDPEKMVPKEWCEFTAFLSSTAEAFAGEPTGQQAERLFGEMTVGGG